MRRYTLSILLVSTLPLLAAGCDEAMSSAEYSAGAEASYANTSNTSGSTATSSATTDDAEHAVYNAPERGPSEEGDGATGGAPASEPFLSQDADAGPPRDPGSTGTTDGNDGESYEPVGTNPFVVVAHDPQSTFATDVDTASYDIFRRDLQYGWLPHPDGVRLEEYLNSFTYDYEAPPHDSEMPFGFSLEAAPNPFNDTTLVRIGIRGKDAAPDEAKPANLVFLVDVSGSMSSAAKLPLVKTVLNETLEILQPTDTVSIVTYAGYVGVRLAPTQVSQKATIQNAINTMTSGGSTAGAAGLDLAYEQAQAGFLDGGINHVILCSDGDFNVGPSSDAALVELIEEKRKTGITLTVLGFGSGNLNDSMMEKVSNAGNGVYGVIINQDQAIQYVHERMLSTLTFIAKDVKIQVEFNETHVLAYRLLGYENRAIADHLFTDDTIDAGEIGINHTVTALYEVVHADGTIPQVEGAPLPEDGTSFDGELDVLADEFLRVKIRFKDVDATEEDPAYATAFGLTEAFISDHIDDTTEDFRFAAAVAAFAEVLKESPYGNLAQLQLIQELALANTGDKGNRLEFTDLLDQAIEMLDVDEEEIWTDEFGD